MALDGAFYFLTLFSISLFVREELLRIRLKINARLFMIGSPGALSPLYSYKLLKRLSLVLPTANPTA